MKSLKIFELILSLLFTILVVFSCNKKDQLSTPPINLPKEILATPNPIGKGLLIVMDFNTNIIKQKSMNVSGNIFQRWVFDNKIRYSYLEADTTGIIQRVGYVPGTMIITDTNFNELSRIRLLPHNDHNSLYPLDGHDFILINDNHYIALAYYEKVVNNIPANLNPVANCIVITPILQEVKNGKVIWEWDGSIYPEFYAASVESNDFSTNSVPHDYIHVNSLFIDPRDNNLICSFRNTDQIVKIHRTNGNIIWRLGGINSDFPLTADMKFLRQHHATLADNNQTLLLYDNGDAAIRPSTRVLEFKLDEIKKQVISYKPFPLGFFSQFRGSVQKTDSSYFIGSGERKFLEINYKTGQTIWEKDLPFLSYRVLRY